ncbi:MAG: DUF389 domain-containing protein [Bacteroidota bacterium]|nr:DUF389 domain-containing protein [Bacteroidota bacterium]
MDANFNRETQEGALENSKTALKQDAKGLFLSLKTFLFELLDFRHDTDREATISAIKADISIKGATAWILICSIFVCSIGLNADSTAVVIGAMLISPLMGPILGVGLSVATNDIDTLKKSMINLGTMIVLSLLTAALCFLILPLYEGNSELFARTKPDIRDVFIAFFGGLALIIARTKKGTIATVIFGVAIATALMPPLCTAGYGLSQGNWDYFKGAMYLFAINTLFIALATFLVLKFLRLPMLTYTNSRKRRNIARIVATIAFALTLHASWTFYEVLQESKYTSDYENFKKNEINNNPSLWLQRDEIDIDSKTITLTFNGDVSDATKSDLLNELSGYQYLKGFTLSINGNSNRSTDKILDLYDIALDKIEARDATIETLSFRIDSLKLAISYKENSSLESDFINLAKDIKIQFPELENFGYSKFLESSNFRTIDSSYVAKIKWNTTLADSLKSQKVEDLKRWLKDYSGLDKIEVLMN